MSTENTSNNFIFRFFTMSTIAALATLFAGPVAAADNTESARAAVTKQITRGGRDGVASDSVRHEYSALTKSGQRETSASSKTAGGSASSARAASNDFWFYDADVILFNDDDNDGYFHGIDLLFDADTYFDEVDVYAAVFLSYEGGPWNEYAVTDDFTIFGATSDDEYVVITELESGYPAGNYDLLIELYDAWDGTFLASVGPAENSSLSYLPLEDYQRDAPYVEEIVVIGHGGGGAALLLLPLALLFRAIRSSAPAARQPPVG